MTLLRSQGHEVALFSMADPRGERTPYDHNYVPLVDFKAASGLRQKTQLAGHAIYSRDARSRIRAMIDEFQPDVAHVRNIYHHLSPSILWELKARDIPVVYHLNDFKVLCPSYNFVSRGETCENCKDGAFWNILRTPCYSGGLGARMTLMAEAYVHRLLGTFRKCVDLFLAPSRFVRDKFAQHGWDTAVFEVLQHFQRAREFTRPEKNAPVLYIGRLSAEKGVADLLRAMQKVPHMRLIVAGDGPERAKLQSLTASLRLTNVAFVGQVDSEQRDALIAQSQFTVLPSHAYETLGKTILESYAGGRTVVASDMGSRRELVREGETGLLYPTGDADKLARAIETLEVNPELAERMGRAGWEFVRQNHQPEDHYRRLMSLYERVIAKKRGHRLSPTSKLVPSKPSTQQLSVIRLPMVDAQQKKKLRIAFIGGRGLISKYNGIETYYEEVGKNLVEMGHVVTIYCRAYFTPPLAVYKGMRLVRLPTIRSKHFETVVHTLLSTVDAMRQQYDIVHYHCLGPALFSFFPRLVGMKTAVTVQGLDWQRKKWGRIAAWMLQLGEKASVRLPNATIVVSQALQEYYREKHRVEPFYVPNGGVLREWIPPCEMLKFGIEPGKYILFLGRFSPEKGCHVLVEAFERLDTDLKLVMAGASSYCDEYSRELKKHASDRIRMFDWISGYALDELITNATIFVLPSDMEGLSLALLDAMGAGLCVVASDVPENCEVVEGAGFTFERGNSSDLAERLRFLIANPGVRQAVGKVAKRRIENRYQWPTITAEIEKAYVEMLKSEPTPFKKPSTRVEEKPIRAKRFG
jgi:glycosyltransferase involved in cell wall biosynthesis